MRTIIIKLGGSLVVPDNIDTDFLKQFKNLIESYVKRGFKFGIVVGGGKTARQYQSALSKFTGDKEHLDNLGISTTKLNAHMIQLMFGDLAYDEIIEDYSKKIEADKPIVIGAGYKPSWSTDYDTVILAEEFGKKEIIVLSNIEHVYDKDPNKFSDAKPYKKLSWGQMLDLCKGPWTPGLNAPLDPKAAKQGAKNNHKVVFLKGLDNLVNYLDGKEFVGTVVLD